MRNAKRIGQIGTVKITPKLQIKHRPVFRR
jgi:hypothetical protein